MAISLGSNISALRTIRQLDNTTHNLAATSERLASGQRINRAADDAAGLSIASSLNADARVLNQGIRNFNDGVSLLNIAEGALSSLSNIVTRQKELAAQAANGVYTLQQRRALDGEANALVNEYNRIIQSTSFNGVRLLDRSISTLSLQGGYGSSGILSVGVGNEFDRTVGTGSLSSAASYAAGTNVTGVGIGDLNGDGIAEIVNSLASGNLNVMMGNGDGSFKAGVSYSAGGGREAVILDINGDNKTDVVAFNGGGQLAVFLGNGDGTLKARSTFSTLADSRDLAVADFNGDGKIDFASAMFANNGFTVVLGNGDGTFKAYTSYSGTPSISAVEAADFNNDGIIDIATTNLGDLTASIFLGNGDGKFHLHTSFTPGGTNYELSAADLNNDGYTDLAFATDGSGGSARIRLGNGDGSFKASVSYTTDVYSHYISVGDINGDGMFDLFTANYSSNSVAALIGNGDGSFKARSLYATGGNGPHALALGDVNGDSVFDVVTADRSSAVVSVFLAKTENVTTVGRLYLLSQEGARSALTTLDQTLERISLELGSIGSFQSRLAVGINNLSSSRENYIAANSRIMDADIAQESANLIRHQILQQAASSVLAQANQQPALSLQLLGR